MTNGEKRSMGIMSFEVKKLPKPLSSFLRKSGEFSLRRREICSFPIIKADYGESFVFTGLKLKVINCDIEVYRPGGRVWYEKMDSKFIPPKTKEFFCQKLIKGDRIFFSKIAVKDVNNQTQVLSGIQITVR